MSNPSSEGKPDHPDAAELIARHLARTRYADLPAPVVAAAKAGILDTIGCLLAGTACAEVETITALMQRWGGQASSTVIGYGGLKVPPASAVFANGSAVHQYDYDDTHDAAICHPTSASLVPALAVAEERGDVTGRDIITAVALGNDLTSRVAGAIIGRTIDHPWFKAPVCGLFGATAASAVILGASEEQHLHALGLTLPQVGGTWASLHVKGSSVRSIRDGLAYRNGVLAAELAMQGIRGDGEVFDGKYGFYQSFYRGQYHRGELVDDLGKRFETTRISLKPWPSIRHLHSTLTAVLEIMTKHALQFDDIAAVNLEVGQVNLDRCRPVSLGSVPANHIDLLGNMHFAVAAAIRHRSVPLALYRDTAMADEVIRNAMPKVHWKYDARQDGAWTLEPGRAEIVTTGGARHAALCNVALGHPDNPMSEAQRHAKFRDCAQSARAPLPASRANEIIELVERLENVGDIAWLMQLLA